MSSLIPSDMDRLLDHFFGPPSPPTKLDHVLRSYFYGPRPCPVCHQSGGFHDRDVHDEHQVPRELLKEAGWHKKKDE